MARNGNINMCMIQGRVGKDPEFKTSQQGKEFAKIAVATNRYHKDGTEDATWHDVVVWNQHLVKVAKWIKKGNLVHVCGELNKRKYTDTNGHDRYAVEISVAFDHAELMVVVGDKKDSGENTRSTESREEIPFDEAFPEL